MANFKYKKLPLGFYRYKGAKFIRINRVSNHTLLKFLQGESAFMTMLRGALGLNVPVYDVARSIAVRRGLIKA